ncbi:MAG: hypothetical protein KAT35_03460 [Candidatus Aenigmarchaeota archaeon]|nr:hypothetical protein [Candidatus Aenigmarchaeota archaeon]
MEENLFDIMERMESLIPEYSYTSVKCIIETDKKFKQVLVSEIKKIKDYMFHVVQVSYELQRDKLSEAAETVWDDISSIVSRIEVSKTCDRKGKQACADCKKRIEKNLRELIRKDRELVVAVKDMKTVAYALYKELLEKGREKYFIKNLDKIKTYNDEIISLLEEREKSILG